VEVRFSGRTRRGERLFIHERNHQHFTSGGVLHNGTHQACSIELGREDGAVLARVAIIVIGSGNDQGLSE